MNVIPDNNDNANIVAPIEGVDKDEDVDANKEAGNKEEDQAVVCLMPATNKTL